MLGTPVGAAPGGEQAAQQGQQAAATVVEPPLPPALDPLLSWQIDRADIKLLRKMAGGGFGQVRRRVRRLPGQGGVWSGRSG